MPKMRFRPGLWPGPRWRAHDAPPGPLVSRGRDTIPHLTPPSVFGASILASSALAPALRSSRSPLVPPPKPAAPRCFRAGYGPTHV